MSNSLRSALSRRQFLALGGGTAAAAALTACSGQGGGGAGPGGPPQRGGSFSYVAFADISETFDLHAVDDLVTYQFASPLYSKLVELRSGPDMLTSTEIIPDLAERWEVSQDGLTYTFHLRDNVTWHDIPPVSGRPFTSDDVMATFTDIIERPSPLAWMFQHVADMQAPDDHTFVIRLNQVYAPFVTYLAHAGNVIVPREHVERQFDIDTQIIGTGPFMLDTYSRDEQMIRVRNPNYYVPERPYLDEVNTVIIPDTNAAASSFISGRLDSTLIPGVQIERFRGMSDVTLKQTGWTPVALYMHSEKPPFDDFRVRRAIALAIDYEGMGRTVYPDFWELSSAIPRPCGEFALSAEEIKQVRPFNPEESRRLLAEAGYPNGFDTRLLQVEISPRDVPSAEYMIQDLSEVGINVELEVGDLATAIDRQINGQFEMSKALKRIEFPDTYLSDFLPGARLNYSRTSDQQLTRMIEENRATFDHDTRVQQFHEISRYVETEVATPIYGIAYWSPTAIRNTTHNYHPSQYQTGKWWADVWIES